MLAKPSVISRGAEDVANLKFIVGKAKRVISNKPPKEFLAFFAAKSGEAGFTVQQVPLDPELLDTPAHITFLKVRREGIARRLNLDITG